MDNLHEITEQIAQAFGFPPSDDQATQDLLGQLLTTLLEQLVARSFSYLSSNDQQILDGMLDADASPEDVISFLRARVPELPQLTSDIVAVMRTHADETLALADEPTT